MHFPRFLRPSALVIATLVGLSACNDSSDTSKNDTKPENQPSSLTANRYFNRVASFPVCLQLDEKCNTDTNTAAEIVATTSDGMQLIYTDSPNQAVGFIDITNPSKPVKKGIKTLSGEPTSVAVKSTYALIAVNTSSDFINSSGKLDILDIKTREIVHSINLGGQPDSVAISPDGQYAAVVIENERDESLGKGEPPQLPAGYLLIIDLQGKPDAWKSRKVELTGLSDLFTTDPEPEYVDINSENIAVVTLQENNYIVLVNLVDGSIVNHFSAGTVDLAQIDTKEEKPAEILLTDSLNNVAREPDGVTWIDNDHFVTADEGDLNGGGRGFTIFDKTGKVVYTAGNTLEHQAVRMGHYPDSRSENKGNEPENADYGVFGNNKYLFIASERSSLIFVYDIADSSKPVLKQTLPAASGPEGVLAIPQRNLLIAASEVDNRDDKLRAAVNIYQYAGQTANYPTILSDNNDSGVPISWGALSGLGADPKQSHILYSVEDSYYGRNRIFKLDVSRAPAKITQAIRIKDSYQQLAKLSVAQKASDNAFDTKDLAAMLNADQSVNIDPEGIAVTSDGFWVVSEGAGTIGDKKKPITSLNLLLKLDSIGAIKQVITLPDEVNAMQVRYGFEGVAEYNGKVYVAFQRAWGNESNPRIGIYDTTNQHWSFVYYPLDQVASQNKGWVGLSDISSLGDGTFLVLERDNQSGPDAAIKRLYKVDLNNVSANTTLQKTLVRDLIPDLRAQGGLIPEKIEGSAVLSNGDVMIVNDNDGVKGNSGETLLLNLGKLEKLN